MFTPYSIVNPLTSIQISRRLHRPGEVLVRTGESVEPMQTVAEAIEPPAFRIVDIARELNVPIKKVKSYVKVRRGDVVAQGDLLASRGGLGGVTCRAPIDGTVVGSGRGRLLLEATPQTIRLSALIPGIVVEVWPTHGARIETIGALIQSAWGNKREAYGVISVAVRAPRHALRPKHIDASSQGAIVVGGARLDEETIDQAIEMQVRGIIVGGIPLPLLEQIQALDFPVIATEGIGSTPMSQTTFELLRSLSGREAAVCGKMGTRWEAERPYIMIPMPTGSAKPINPETPLQVGSPVRVLRAPYYGRSGTVLSIPTAMIQLETGLRVPGVEIDFGGNETGLVPYANLELIL